MAIIDKKIDNIYEKLPPFLGNVLGVIGGLNKYINEKQYSGFKTYLSDILRSQRENIYVHKERQLTLFQKLITHAYNYVPYYKYKFDGIGLHPSDIKTLNDVKNIPLLTKNEIKKDPGAFVATNMMNVRYIKQGTSGTTGSPFTVMMDQNTLIWEKVWIQRHRIWGGYSKADWRGTFGGHKIVPSKQSKPPFWRYNIIGKQILFSTYHMTSENLRYYFRKIRMNRINIIDGYPSTIFIFAKYLADNKKILPMKAVFTGAEPIFDYQRKVIEKVFQCKIFDHYGLTEKVVSAGECEAHEGRHVTMEGTYVEIVPISEKSNNYGEIIGTSLVNYYMPLIRYRTGDMSAFIEGRCTCGRELVRIRPVETKMEDIITTPSGRYISASNLTFAFKPLSTIQEAQIIQEDLKNIRIRIVKGKGYSEEDAVILLKGLKSVLGNSFNMHVEFNDHIERTKTGKFRFVISKVPFNV